MRDFWDKVIRGEIIEAEDRRIVQNRKVEGAESPKQRLVDESHHDCLAEKQKCYHPSYSEM